MRKPREIPNCTSDVSYDQILECQNAFRFQQLLESFSIPYNICEEQIFVAFLQIVVLKNTKGNHVIRQKKGAEVYVAQAK